MMLTLYKYQGAGNDFLIADNRDGTLRLSPEQVARLCDRRYGVGADGLMLLETSDRYDFRMVYYNSDGSGGMMCGNGGRCIVAFAADRGVKNFEFEAADGYHCAEILSDDGIIKTVRLKMTDVLEIKAYESLEGIPMPSKGYFLNTGTRHYVRFVDDVEHCDVVSEGRQIRYASEFMPEGANVNFVEPCGDVLKVRTYEKGVEDETNACGTGIVASCLAAWSSRAMEPQHMGPDRFRYDVRAKRDALAVEFTQKEDMLAADVWLTGPAAYVAEIKVNI